DDDQQRRDVHERGRAGPVHHRAHQDADYCDADSYAGCGLHDPVIGRRPETFNTLDACPADLDAGPFGVDARRPGKAALAGKTWVLARAGCELPRVLAGVLNMCRDTRVRPAADLPETRPLIHGGEAVESTI